MCFTKGGKLSEKGVELIIMMCIREDVRWILYGKRNVYSNDVPGSLHCRNTNPNLSGCYISQKGV